MGLRTTLSGLRTRLGDALGRGMDKVAGDQPDLASRSGANQSYDPLWGADAAAAALPPELRGGDSQRD